MTLSRRLIPIFAFTTTVITALIYNYQMSYWHALSIALLGILWYRLGSVRVIVPQIGFLCFSLLVSLDVLRHGITIWSIITMHSVVALWDLQAFSLRMVYPDSKQEYWMITQHHIYRLGYVIAISLLLSLGTLYLRTNLSLIGIIVGGLVLMMTLSSGIKLLRRDSA